MRISLSRRMMNRTLVTVMLISMMALPAASAELPAAQAQGETGNGQEMRQPPEGSYEHYLQQYEGEEQPREEIMLNGADYTGAEGMSPEVLTELGGETGRYVRTEESGSVEWQLDVPKSGLYHISVRYYPVKGKSSAIERELLIDGKLPFTSARNLSFGRIWVNENPEIQQDNRDNDLRPRQIEAPAWQETLLRDTEGYYEEPYQFYLSAGRHTLTMVSSREPMVIDYIKLHSYAAPAAYAEVKQSYEAKGYKATSGHAVKVQGKRRPTNPPRPCIRSQTAQAHQQSRTMSPRSE